MGLVCAEADEIDPDRDLEAVADLAACWYHRPAGWCLNHLREWHERGVIAHLGVRESGKFTSACRLPNVLRKSTAALFYLYAPDESFLVPLLVKAVDRCIAFGASNLIAD